jgi:hypothetical protein
MTVYTRAQEAKDLRDNPVFCAILQEMTAEAVALFANAQSDIVAISAAHEKIRAVQHVRDALTARIDAAKFEDHKKDRDRGRHD